MMRRLRPAPRRRAAAEPRQSKSERDDDDDRAVTTTTAPRHNPKPQQHSRRSPGSKPSCGAACRL